MPTFSKTNIDTPDIDPDALTVNLLGPDPDEDDLVKAPENVVMPTIDEEIPVATIPVADIPDAEIPSEMSPATEDMEETIDTVDTGDEEEIRAIEEMLRSKKSARAKMLQEKKETKIANPAKPVKKIDPIVIASAAVAAVLVFIFVAYFAGFFNKNASLGMTLKEFSTRYNKTEAVGVLKEFGFTFPAVTYAEETSTNKKINTFTGLVDNTAGYSVYVTGDVYKSDSMLKAMRIYIQVLDSTNFDDLCMIYAPYIQVLFPKMSTADATAYLSELYTNEDVITVKGSYGLAMKLDSNSSFSYCTLDIISAKEVDAYKKAFASTSATESTSAVQTTAPVQTTAAAS